MCRGACRPQGPVMPHLRDKEIFSKGYSRETMQTLRGRRGRWSWDLYCPIDACNKACCNIALQRCLWLCLHGWCSRCTWHMLGDTSEGAAGSRPMCDMCEEWVRWYKIVTEACKKYCVSPMLWYQAYSGSQRGSHWAARMPGGVWSTSCGQHTKACETAKTGASALREVVHSSLPTLCLVVCFVLCFYTQSHRKHINMLEHGPNRYRTL